MRFPAARGDNLLRQTMNLPQDLEGELNILLIAFQRWQQTLVDTWLPTVQQIEQAHPHVRYYELPTIQRLNVLAQTFINAGMRAGIPDPMARERTITLYVDKAAFRKALELPHEESIYVLLVNRQGQVLWRTEGAYTPDNAAALAAAIRGEDSA
jgi:hypothetical protein